MKKYVVLCFISAILFSCNDPDQVESQSAQREVQERLIISLPAIVLDKLFNDPNSNGDNSVESLTAMWNFDKAVHRSIVENKTIGKFTLTRKINPCCPCSGTDPMCCQCLEGLNFASPASMKARVSLVSSSGKVISFKKETFAADNVDIFTVPVDASDDDYTLEVSTDDPKARLSEKPVRVSLKLKSGECFF